MFFRHGAKLSFLLERITDSQVKNNGSAPPLRIAKPDLIEYPAVIGCTPGFTQGYPKVEAQYQYLKIETQSHPGAHCQLAQKVGFKFISATGVYRIIAETPDITGIYKRRPVYETIQLTPELRIQLQFQVAGCFYKGE